MTPEYIDALKRKAAAVRAEKHKAEKAEYDRERYQAIKADPEKHRERLDASKRRRDVRKELVFESDYIKAGLGHLLEGAKVV